MKERENLYRSTRLPNGIGMRSLESGRIGDPSPGSNKAIGTRASHQAGYAVILCTTNVEPDEEDLHLSALYSRRVDGILLASGHQHMAQISRGLCPLVLVDRLPLGFKGSAIVIDNF